ncbi:helix-turn-helix domain-containing protein [Streptomyces sp. NPDC050560]|uniref:helix-turn-helix domain-containing protein n=1 Tax=Streptomyces sp. NPDC050560 TaxID=3365630 RepID=UPI0037B7C626
MSHEEPLPVPAPLRRWVATATSHRGAASGAPLVHLPDSATSLVFRAMPDGVGRWVAVGPRSHASYHHDKDLPLCVRLRLWPGTAGALLGVAAAELVDRVVPLGELWGRSGDGGCSEGCDGPGGLDGLDGLGGLASSDGLDGAAGSADSGGRADSSGPRGPVDVVGPEAPAAVVRRVGAVLLARAAALSPADLARCELVRAAAATPPGRRERLPALASRFAVSERHLRALFAEGVGLSPKRTERIARVRGVLAAPGAARRWAGVAPAAGYYDQSHMTADFRALMGVPPAAYAAGRLPTLAAC